MLVQINKPYMETILDIDHHRLTDLDASNNQGGVQLLTTEGLGGILTIVQN